MNMKKIFAALFIQSMGAGTAQAHRGGGHHHDHRDRNNNDVDAGDAFAVGVLVGLLSSSTMLDAVDDDYSRTVLENVAVSIVTGEENELLNSVLSEMEGDDQVNKELLLIKIEEALAAE